MSLAIVFVLMIFCHIVDDYYLQGCLANLKQKDFWKKNAPDSMYKYDYIVALIMHAFSWAFMISLPILIFTGFAPNLIWFFATLGMNTAIHAFVDDAKANRKIINLIGDQTIHIIQIIATFGMFLATI